MPECSPTKDRECDDSGVSQPLQALAPLLLASHIDVVFPVIHGLLGEDGGIQALCESLSIPWVGSDASASNACYDKTLFKGIMRSAGLPLAGFLAVSRNRYERDFGTVHDDVDRGIGYPCIVKPSRSGSSLGLSRVETPAGLEDAVLTAFAFGEMALIEEFFAGRDVEVGVLGEGSVETGSPIELEFESELYDFEAKYHRGDRRYVPARCSAELLARLRHAARLAFHATGCWGMARVDFLVDLATERFVVNEINTIPYMPEPSTFVQSMRATTGQPYTELLDGLVKSSHALGSPRANNDQTLNAA